MTFDSFLHKISEIKKTTPAGLRAHQMMTPKERMPFLQVNEFLDRQPKKSAVMMLCYPKNNTTAVLLIERAVYKGVHSGQVAFPGGKYELEDVDLMYTALRETNEEVGISAGAIEVIKPFSPVYVPPSNFVIQPYLGIATVTPTIIPALDEVANIIELPLELLLDDSIVKQVQLKTSYAEQTVVPAFIYNNYTIWGATAMMLSELKVTLKGVLVNEETYL